MFSFVRSCGSYCASMMAQMLKNPPAMQQTLFQSLDQEDSLEKGILLEVSILCQPHFQNVYNPSTIISHHIEVYNVVVYSL